MTYSPNFTGNATDVPSKSVGDEAPNDTGITITKTTPVGIDGNGDIATVNVSIEASALSVVGVAAEDILDGEVGDIANSGRVEDISTTASNGDVLYVDKNGDLTTTKPTLGVGGFISGDFVIFIGTVTKNQDNALNQDLLVNISVLGQL